MAGEAARETGSPDYRHPSRTEKDFNEHIDDFSVAVIALSLKALTLRPELRELNGGADTLLLTERDFREPDGSAVLRELQGMAGDSELSLLLGAFNIALAKNSLDLVSFRLFMTEKPELDLTSSYLTYKECETITTNRQISSKYRGDNKSQERSAADNTTNTPTDSTYASYEDWENCMTEATGAG